MTKEERKLIAKKVKQFIKQQYNLNASVTNTGGKLGYIQAAIPTGMVYPAELRNKSLDIIYGEDFQRSRENPNAGDVRSDYITMIGNEWQELLDSYGFEYKEPVKRESKPRQIKLLPPEEKINRLREIVKEHQCEKLEGTLIDVQTANVILTVHDSKDLSEENRQKFVNLPLRQMASIAWKLVS